MFSLTKLLGHWRADPSIGGNITVWETVPARKAQFVPIPESTHPSLAHALLKMGIRALYTHQGESWDLAQSGKNLAVVTGTASGKTLCYSLPILDDLLRNSEARALFLFPTKALAQDQLTGIKDLLAAAKTHLDGNDLFVVPATYDGDTPGSVRMAMRNRSRLVISNPDMLHTGILPHHTRWATFFQGLHYVVIDEMHTYRGVFGSHVANILRRLKRIAIFYGADLQFILTSATIGNPGELAEHLIEAPVTVIDEDGSAHGEKHFLIYNPPVIDPNLGLRASMMGESMRIAKDLLAYQIQTILFGRTRRSVELMLRALQEVPSPTPPGLSAIPLTPRERGVRAYRSGYLPKQRREIEAGLRKGQVRAVIATTALELGIDIGQIGAAVLAGYPGSIAGTWQQAGRAGRRRESSLAVLVASPNPLDQFLAKHPAYFFEQPPEQALINPDNPLILLDHLQCAAFELPFKDGESFGGLDSGVTAEFLEFLREAGTLHKSGQKFFWMADQYPAAGIFLRNASAARFLLQDTSGCQARTIGEVDGESASWMVHPEAIYLHEGESYLVDDLDLEGKLAFLHPVDVDYYTRPRQETKVQLLEILGEEATPGGHKAHGEIAVTTQVTGYHKIRWGTHEKLGTGKVSLPPTELQTTGYWLTLSPETVEGLRTAGLWNNDPNDYGPNWHSQRNLARERDNYICQVCGTPEGAHTHHVHHKTPFRAFTSPIEANRLGNLITLCPGCHQRIESTMHIRSGLAGLAYILGNLAPLFLMCDSRDLGIHADPKSSLTEGGPAVVIYDMVPAGIGFSQHLYEIHSELLARAHDLAASCDCKVGCPSCVGPGGEEGAGSKKETLAILDALASSRNNGGKS